MSIKLTPDKIKDNLLKWGRENNIFYKLYKYNGNKSDIEYHCCNCGYNGKIKYYNIQQGYKCRECGIKKRAIKRTKYTKEYCKEIITKYKTIKDFYTYNKNVYQVCVKNKWLNELTSKLRRETSLKERCLYAIYFPNKVVYIGLTFNFEKRMYEHLFVKGTVYDYINLYKVHPINKKVLLEHLDEEQAQSLEKRMIKYFIWLGYNILNKCDGGSLGQVTSRINKYDCKKILENIKYDIHLFRSSYTKYYNKCVREKWLSEIIPNYVDDSQDFSKNTLKELKEKVKKYSTRIECYKNNNKLYSYLQRYKLLDRVFKVSNQRSKKPIEQYDLEGKYIASFPSISEASKKLHISIGGIIFCCQEKQFSAGGFQWKYVNSDKKISDKIPINKKSKKIYQFDNNKKLINKFDSIKEASISTNIDATSISQCSLKKRKRAGGFIWIRESDINDIDFYYKNNKGLTRNVYQYSIDNRLIAVYRNTVEASKSTYISRSAINNCLLKKSRNAGGYIWKYCDSE